MSLFKSRQRIADRYLLDCGLRLSFVPGRAEKVAHVQQHPLFPQIDEYLDTLADAGIKSPYDGSVFIPGLDQPFTVIDVATWEAMAELTDFSQPTGDFPITFANAGDDVKTLRVKHAR